MIEHFVHEFEGRGGVARVLAQPDGGEGANGEGLKPRGAADATTRVELEHEIGGASHVTHEPSHRLLIFGEQFVQVAGSLELPPPVGEGDVVGMGLTGQRGESREGVGAFVPGMGTAFGAALGTVQSTPIIFNRTERVANKRYNTLRVVQEGNRSLDRHILAADKSGIDTKRFISESDLLVGAVDETGTVNSKAAVENLNDRYVLFKGCIGVPKTPYHEKSAGAIVISCISPIGCSNSVNFSIPKF